MDARIYKNRSLMELCYLSLAIYIVVDAIILFWFTAAPYLAWSSNRLFLGLSMSAYDYGYLLSNCHQMPQRSLFLSGIQYPFCARDLGIYLGCLIGALAALKQDRLPNILAHPVIFIILLAPMPIDGITQTILGLRESNNHLRIATGILFGFGLVYFIAKRIVEHTMDIKKAIHWKKAVVIGAIILAILFSFSFYIAPSYVMADEAITKSGLNPDLVTHVPQRALRTLRWDPYLASYDDPLLLSLARYNGRGHGVWVVYAGPEKDEGKKVYAATKDGKLVLIADRVQ